MISIAWIRRRVNVGLTGLLASLLMLGVGFLTPSLALAATTATPTYTCGNYGANAYGSCDTVVNDATSTDTTTGTTTTTTGDTGTTTGNGQTTTGTETPGDKSGRNYRWLFIISFLIFLFALFWFFLLFWKRRKRDDEDDQKPPQTPQAPQPPTQNLWQ